MWLLLKCGYWRFMLELGTQGSFDGDAAEQSAYERGLESEKRDLSWSGEERWTRIDPVASSRPVPHLDFQRRDPSRYHSIARYHLKDDERLFYKHLLLCPP